jgi:hypothetical protein
MTMILLVLIKNLPWLQYNMKDLKIKLEHQDQYAVCINYKKYLNLFLKKFTSFI